MNTTTAKKMKGVAIDRFGGLETLSVKSLPVPQVGDDEILIHVESAGVGAWDPFEREGGFAKLLGIKPKFPYVLGSDGAGTVAAVGRQVAQFGEGDRVYACSLANPKGGFYAEYATAKADNAAHVPDKVSTEQAGVLMIDAVTALCGLDKALGLKEGESVMVIGARGGIGHLAVQFAKRMGAQYSQSPRDKTAWRWRRKSAPMRSPTVTRMTWPLRSGISPRTAWTPPSSRLEDRMWTRCWRPCATVVESLTRTVSILNPRNARAWTFIATMARPTRT